MDKKYTVTVVESGNGFSINIPRELCKEWNIRKGDKLTISKHSEIMVIRRDEIIHSAKGMGWKLMVMGTKPATKSSYSQPAKPEESNQDQKQDKDSG